MNARESMEELRQAGNQVYLHVMEKEFNGMKIVDKDTKKVIRELPPEKTLDMIAKAWELAGILVDEKR